MNKSNEPVGMLKFILNDFVWGLAGIFPSIVTCLVSGFARFAHDECLDGLATLESSSSTRYFLFMVINEQALWLAPFFKRWDLRSGFHETYYPGASSREIYSLKYQEL